MFRGWWKRRANRSPSLWKSTAEKSQHAQRPASPARVDAMVSVTHEPRGEEHGGDEGYREDGLG